MTGTECYQNKYDSASLKRIAECDESWMLEGFYNSILINKSYSSAYLYIHYVIHFCESVKDINNISVDDYYRYLASLKRKSSSSQIDAYHALQRYSKYLCARGICDDYMALVERPKYVETQKMKDKRENGYLTKEEIKYFVGQIYNGNSKRNRGDAWKARDYAIVMIFLTTGIRCAELYKLDVTDFNMAQKYFVILGKGEKSRKIYLAPDTCDAIKMWLKYRDDLVYDEDALFVSQRRTRMTTKSIYEMISNLGSTISGKKITPHKLRATYGTCLYDETGDVYLVQNAMGHSNPKTTELYIRGQKNKASKEASKIMSNIIGW